MAQDLTLGRAGLATSAGGDGLVLRADSWSQEGDRASVSGVIRGRDLSSLADVKALRDQLVGYGPENTDEPVVPVTWAQDSSRDGFYRVVKVETGSELTGRLRAGADGGELAVPWSAELVRVPGWQAPLFEVVTSGALRSNVHSVTNGTIYTWCSIPGDADSYYHTTWGSATPGLVTTSNGSIVSFIEPADTGYTGAVQYRVSAANYYSGQAYVESSADSGSTWRTVTGRQIANNVTGWRAGNGLSRVQFATNGDITVGHWDGAGWETTDFEINYDAGAAIGNWTSVTVLRNSPEVVTVAAIAGSSAAANNLGDGAQLAVTLYRGHPLVFAHFSTGNPSGAEQYGLFRTTTEAGTTITGGVQATSANGDGNKFVIMTGAAVTKETSVSGVYATANVSTIDFGFGTSSTSYVSTVTATNTYFAAMNHRQSVTAR